MTLVRVFSVFATHWLPDTEFRRPTNTTTHTVVTLTPMLQEVEFLTVPVEYATEGYPRPKVKTSCVPERPTERFVIRTSY